jgi:hypothetical protein
LPSKRTLTVRLFWILAVTVPTLLASRGRFAPSALILKRSPTLKLSLGATGIRFLPVRVWGVISAVPVIQKAGDYSALHPNQ